MNESKVWPDIGIHNLLRRFAALVHESGRRKPSMVVARCLESPAKIKRKESPFLNIDALSQVSMT